jgi:hypothetical protein
MLSFCWRVRSEELRHPAAAAVLQMIRDVALPNLWLDATEPPQQLIQRASFGVAMPCTALLTYQQANKPVLVFACELLSRATGVHPEATFANYFELNSALEKLRAHPEGSRVQIAVETVRADALDAALREATSSSDLTPGWLRVAERYAAFLQTAAPVVTVRAPQHELPKHDEKLNRILDRLGIIQRSTIGYKALKLMSALTPTKARKVP